MYITGQLGPITFEFMEIVKTMPSQVADITNYLSTKFILNETFQVYQVIYASQISTKTKIIYEIATPLNGSFFKPFKKLAARVLSDLKHSVIAWCFKLNKILLLVF